MDHMYLDARYSNFVSIVEYYSEAAADGQKI